MDKSSGADSATVPIIGDEQQSIQRRVADFSRELKALMDKYEVQLVAEPFIQSGLIVALPKIIDARAKATNEIVKENPDESKAS